MKTQPTLKKHNKVNHWKTITEKISLSLTLIFCFTKINIAQTHVHNTDQINSILQKNHIPLNKIGLDNALSHLKDVKIIGMGESSHGTSEFVTSKTKLIQILNSGFGFNRIILELPFASTFQLNEYITTGKGDAEKIISGLGYNLYITKEFITLIEWLKQQNKNLSPKHQIKIYGMDFYNIGNAVPQVLTFLEKNNNALKGNIEESFNELNTIMQQYWPVKIGEKQNELKEIQNNLVNLSSKLKAQKTSLIQKTSSNQFFKTVTLVQIIEQWVSHQIMNTNAELPNNTVRSNKMAQNAIDIIEHDHHNTKFIIWAHNFHIYKNLEAEHSKKTLGQVLSDRYRQNYYALALELGKGESLYRTFGKNMSLSHLDTKKAPETNNQYFSWYLSQLKSNACYIDFKALNNTEVAPLKQNFLFNYFDWLGPKTTTQTISPASHFDGILFINTTHPTSPTKGAKQICSDGLGY